MKCTLCVKFALRQMKCAGARCGKDFIREIIPFGDCEIRLAYEICLAANEMRVVLIAVRFIWEIGKYGIKKRMRIFQSAFNFLGFKI